MALGAALWLFSGYGLQNAPQASAPAAAQTETREILPRVRIQLSVATMRKREVVLRGRTEAERKVVVRAETMGTVAEVPLEKGVPVLKDTPLCILSLDARAEQQKESEAMMKLRRLELEVAEKLAAQGHRAQTGLAQARAAYSAAQMRLKQSRINMENTTITAPFDGFLEDVHVEKGDFMNGGAACATVIDLTPLLMVGQVAEADLPRLKMGMPAYAILKDGRRIEGYVRYISGVADPRTRTFRIEVAADQKIEEIREGMTAEIHIPGAIVAAHRIAPAILSLSDQGKIGVRVVDDSSVAHFIEVEIISGKEEVIWVAGLPDNARIIVVGQEYVRDGTRVKIAQVKEGGDFVSTDSPQSDERRALRDRDASGEGS